MVVKVTKEMFANMEYDASMDTTKSAIGTAAEHSKVKHQTVMIVFSDSDLNASSYHLTQSLQNPFASNAIVSVLVQESIFDDFTAKVQEKMIPYTPSANLNQSYAGMLEKISQFNAKTIRPNQVAQGNCVAPTIVCDFTHEQLGVSPGIITTLHSFRTTKEAIALNDKQPINFANASIWSENHARAYEIVAAIRSENFYINCFNVSHDCLKDRKGNKSSFAAIDKGYHYEAIASADGSQKSVVFPFGTIFAN